jgi:low affinity Fe/Cu permease
MSPLEADQPKRLRKMIDIYERYAKEKGLVPVSDDWNPWESM